MCDRRSVFDRLGPLEAEEEVAALPGGSAGGKATREPATAAQGLAPPPGLSKRISVSHPLVARQLLTCQQDRRARADSRANGGSSRSSSRGPAAGPGAELPPMPARQPQAQQRRQRRPKQRSISAAAAAQAEQAPSPLPQQQQGQQAQQRSRGGSPAAAINRDQQAAAGGDSSELREQLRRLQAEREAADEMMQQMAAQAQALLADKQQLQRQAAQLAAEKAQLEERLEYLLPPEEEEWAAGCGDEEDGGSGGSSACQPATPSAASLGEGVVAALQGRLDELAAERQLQLLALGKQAGLSSSGHSSPGSDVESAQHRQQQGGDKPC